MTSFTKKEDDGTSNEASAMMTTSSARQRSSSRQRTGRSFSRVRQTRVTSVSPSPTLVGGGGRVGRSTSRGTYVGRSRTPVDVASGFEHEKSLSEDTLRERRASRSRSVPLKPNPGNKAGAELVQDGTVRGPNDIESATGAKARTEKEDEAKKPLAVRLLPRPLPYFLGFRSEEPISPLLPFVRYLPRQVEALLWAWIGGFVGIAIVEVIFARPHHFSTSPTDLAPHAWQSPIIVGSFGASSVLLYATPASPLSQPRAFVGGQTLSALTGVVITKLVSLSSHYNLDTVDRPSSLVWLAGAISVGTALCVMMMTGTLHPPGGATALLCATNQQVAHLGWKAVPVVLLSSLLMLVWAMIWMNLGRAKYPHASFIAPSPPSPDAGNTSQWIFNWLSEKRRPMADEEKTVAGGKAEKEKDDVTVKQQGMDSNMARIEEGEVMSRANGKLADPIWRDESPWSVKARSHDRKALVVDEEEIHYDDRHQVTEEEEEEEEEEERTERPSRWDQKGSKGLLLDSHRQ